jgi:hypothetical protein
MQEEVMMNDAAVPALAEATLPNGRRADGPWRGAWEWEFE